MFYPPDLTLKIAFYCKQKSVSYLVLDGSYNIRRVCVDRVLINKFMTKVSWRFPLQDLNLGSG